MTIAADLPCQVPTLRSEASRMSLDTPEGCLETTRTLVLAGGRGTRLKQMTDTRAKPVVPFAGTLKVIDFTLSNCVNSGIRQVKVLTQYQAPGLISHLASAWRCLDAGRGKGIEVASMQHGECWYRGTADAVHQNAEMLREGNPAFVLVLAGDHVYKMDYGCLVVEHARRDADVTIACVEVPLDQASAFGIVNTDPTGRVLTFIEKPTCPLPAPGQSGGVLASMGVYVFRADVLWRELGRDSVDSNSGHDFGRDILPALVARSRVFAHDFAASCVRTSGAPPYWRDVGTLDAYWAGNLDLTRSTPALDLYDPSWPIRGQALQLAGAKFSADETGQGGTATDSVVCGGSVVKGATVLRSLLSPQVFINEGSQVEDSVLLTRVRVGRNVVLKRTIIDEGCTLPDGIKIGVWPAEDAARFTVTASGVTLVTAEMLRS